MQLIATLPHGLAGNSATDEFWVDFTGSCDNISLTAPVIITESPLEGTLYEPIIVKFQIATSSNPECGDIKYEVIDTHTNEKLVMDVIEW